MPRAHTTPAARIAASNLATALGKIEALDRGNGIKCATLCACLAKSQWDHTYAMRTVRDLLREAAAHPNLTTAAKLARAVADAIECAEQLDQHTNKRAVSAEVA